ncbi:hypothetical protein N0V90_002601 [Kalmusia sp. IMI 367209]|nr:hypothetical protein N0V90_002601 [Kalmusia sp. IMI 367209]
MKFLVELGINVIQVKYLSPDVDHQRCMQAFQDANIYVIATFYKPEYHLDDQDPLWDSWLYKYFTGGIDFMSQWNNSLAFAIVLESSLHNWTPSTLSFVKRIILDLKDYVKEKSYRSIPIGFRHSMFDAGRNDEMDKKRLNYLGCDDSGLQPDFLALELPENCPHEPDIDHIVELYKGSAVPVWVEKLGCGRNADANDPRNYSDVKHVYTEKISKVLVGGVALEFKNWVEASRSRFHTLNAQADIFSPEVVELNGTKLFKLPSYGALSSAFANAPIPTSTKTPASHTPSISKTACPSSSTNWNVPSNYPPSPKDSTKLCSCLTQAAVCVGKRSNVENSQNNLIEEGSLCGTRRSNCPGIGVNPDEGIYGAFTVCDSVDRYTFAASYLVSQGGRSCDSDFDGNAISQMPTNMSEECRDTIKGVGDDGAWLLREKSSNTTDPLPTTLPPDTAPSESKSTTQSLDDLSIGAKIGIGVGVVVLFLILSVALGMFLLQRRRQKSQVVGGSVQLRPLELASQYAYEAPSYQTISEAVPGRRYMAQELPNSSVPVELGARTPEYLKY